jgi:hypothetical protein
MQLLGAVRQICMFPVEAHQTKDLVTTNHPHEADVVVDDYMGRKQAKANQ